jgi:xanthine dehydrogenase accessory factor
MSIYEMIATIQRQGSRAALCTVVRAEGSTPRRAGSKMLVLEDGSIEGSVGGGEMEARVITAAQTCMESGSPELLYYELSHPEHGDPGVCGGQMEVYVEPINPNEQVIVYGAGHVGRAVAELADWLGFDVLLADDRAEMIDELEGIELDTLVVSADKLGEEAPVHSRTAVVMTTRNIGVDGDALPGLLDSEAVYIGVIGSRRRWETAKKKLLEKGADAAKLERVVSPIGLEIQAETPEEIAVSVMAEVIMVLRGGDGKPMSGGKGQDDEWLQSEGDAVE